MRDRPLLSAALERIPPQLEASSEPRGSPQAVEEEPVRAEPPRSPKSVGKDRSVLRVLWRLQTFLCVRGVSAIVHIYTSVLQAPAAAGPNGAPGGGIARVSGRAMQDLGYELPRIPIPRTPVNKPSMDALHLPQWHHACGGKGVGGAHIQAAREGECNVRTRSVQVARRP